MKYAGLFHPMPRLDASGLSSTPHTTRADGARADPKKQVVTFYFFFCLTALSYAFIVNFFALNYANATFLIHYYSIEESTYLLWFLALFAIYLLSFYYVMLHCNKFSFFSVCHFKFYAFICFMLFWPSFTTAKLFMSYFSDFTWDYELALTDMYLHGGYDAWLVYLPILSLVEFSTIDFIYLRVWTPVTFLSALFVILFETNLALRIKFFATCAIIWLGLGNLFAWIFLSAGPVYYENVVGDPERFADFYTAMREYGFEESAALRIQGLLWDSYTSGEHFLGTGISAFPSVHVAMAMLVGLYVWSKLGRLGVIALGYPVAIQVGSVLLGWHYAIDGYVSIIFVALAWRVLGQYVDGPLAARGRARP